MIKEKIMSSTANAESLFTALKRNIPPASTLSINELGPAPITANPITAVRVKMTRVFICQLTVIHLKDIQN